MATYTKALKTIEIYINGAGTAILVADTAEKAYASNALAEFEAGQTMRVWAEQEGTMYLALIPFHAVSYITVNSETTQVEKPDAYGCEEDGGEVNGD